MKFDEIKDKAKEIGAEIADKVSKGSEHVRLEINKLIGPRWDQEKDDVLSRISSLENKVAEQNDMLITQQLALYVMGGFVIGLVIAVFVFGF